MNTRKAIEVKGAIKFLRNHFKIGIYEKKSLDIIALLQQGEKCREYLKKILKRFNKIELADSGMNEETYRENMSSLLSDIACELKQKYFPEEASQDES